MFSAELIKSARAAMRSAGIYINARRDGTFLQTLIDVEQALLTGVPSHPETGARPTRLPSMLETDFMAAAFPDADYTGFNDILDVATASYRAARNGYLGQSFNAEAGTLSLPGMTVVKLGKVIIPSKTKAPITGSDTGGFEPPRFRPRIQTLLGKLDDMGVPLDQLIIYTGEMEDGMMRAQSYAIIALPNGVQISVNNQVGETSFIAGPAAIGSPLEWSIWDKDTLKSRAGITHIDDRFTALEAWADAMWAGIHAAGHGLSVPDLKTIRAAQTRAERGDIPLTLTLIKETLIACRDPKTGEYPSKDSGLITDGPLANGKRTWSAVDGAMATLWRQNPDGSFKYKSIRGLTREPGTPGYCPFKGLGAVKDHYGLVSGELTVQKIVESLRACRDPETGAYPSMDSGLITDGPLANGTRTWGAVHTAMAGLWKQNPDGSFRYKSMNGLTREACPYKGMGEIKHAHGLKPGPWIVDIELPLAPAF